MGLSTKERIKKIIELHKQLNELLNCPDDCEISLGDLPNTYTVTSGIEHIALAFDVPIKQESFNDGTDRVFTIESIKIGDILLMEVVA